jgi:tripartite-type tricarboxylate transporter receptor subunit TctC
MRRASLLILLLWAFVAHAQSWPSKPLRIVVGFAAGGPTDVVARAYADHAGRNIGQPVIVDNKPGANTIIAAESVASAGDGHTILMAATNHTMIPAIYGGRVKFDAVRSFKPICQLAASPTVLVVRSSLEVRSLADFIRLAKEKPSSLTYGTPGVGSSGHFAAELFARQAGILLTHVPYKGAAPVVADLIAGHVDASFATLGSVLSQIRAGKLTALAVASPKRSEQLPSVATFGEGGFGSYSADAWYGLLAPASLPDSHLALLERQARAFVDSPAGSEKLRSLGMDPQAICGNDFARQITRDVDTYKQIARDIDLKVD